ncbi:hypothetical protein JHD50_11990 [Sulfurimonas sp. MAG313]|nr:hypothetical protein [Sulfurimonas sp. MAG313]MDF1882010.1 hypothetical protein [Sulfurimonas sp. MAG313]
MKVIIDLIEDIHAAINNDTNFSLSVMGLKENDKSEFIPSWQSELCSFKLDIEQKKLFLFLGKDEAIKVGDFLDSLNALSNEAMMYEICISYAKEDQRLDCALIGFGESLKDEKYLLFIED